MRYVTINLSDAQEALLSERLAHSDYGSLDELVAGLLEAELMMNGQERLEQLLLEGLESEELEWTPELFQEIRREAGLIP